VTYLGGSGADQGNAIAVTSAGLAVVAGTTSSTDFPTVNAIQPFLAGGSDMFASLLNANGSKVVSSTYWGGSGNEQNGGLALDSDNWAYVTGLTASSDYPHTSAAFQTSLVGGNDAVLSKLALPPMPPTVVPTSASCDCAGPTGEIVHNVHGAAGENPMADAFSATGVRYADGVARLNMTDLASDGFGTPWG
jgi:hypothetical protein